MLEPLIAEAKQAFGTELLSITLYGSGAEGRLRKTSDLNLIFVLKRFDREAVKSFSPKLLFAHATQRIDVMWVLETELAAVVEAFAQKFSDVRRRHTVLYGADLFGNLMPGRAATIFRLRQVLLNAQLRLRDAMARNIEQPDQLVPVIARFAGPLRACAATLRELRGEAALPPKEAFEHFLGKADWLASVSAAREKKPLPSEAAILAIEGLQAAACQMREEAERL